MNSLHLHLLDLLQMSETPLYSAYEWLGRQFGRHIAMPEFFELIQDMLSADRVRLWTVDHESGERKELHDLPADLKERYTALAHADHRYDPYSLSLTLGPKADVNAEAEWEFDLDFERGGFDVRAKPRAVGEALRQLSRYFPTVTVVPETSTLEGSRTHVVGRIVPRGARIEPSTLPRGTR